MGDRPEHREIFSQYISARDVARALDVSTVRVNQIRLMGALPAIYTCLGYLYHKNDVEEYVEARTRKEGERRAKSRT